MSGSYPYTDAEAVWNKIRSDFRNVVGESSRSANMLHLIRSAKNLEQYEGGIQLLKYALGDLPKQGTEEWADKIAAQCVGFFVSHEAKIQLLPTWVAWATRVQRRDIWMTLIFTLSRDWLKANILGYVEDSLNEAEANGDVELYGGVANLLGFIDDSLLSSVMERAKSSANPDIRQYGEQFGS